MILGIRRGHHPWVFVAAGDRTSIFAARITFLPGARASLRSSRSFFRA
jgi:hypothetical protein